MPTSKSIVLLTTVLSALLGLSSVSRPTFASPVPVPLPVMAADYSHTNYTGNRFVESGSHNNDNNTTPKTEFSPARKHSLHPRPQQVGAYTGSANSSRPNPELNDRGIDYLSLIGGSCTQANNKAVEFRAHLLFFSCRLFTI